MLAKAANMAISNYSSYLKSWSKASNEQFDTYRSRQFSFVPFLLPELALKLSEDETIALLTSRLGPSIVQKCLDPDYTMPSPAKRNTNSKWIKRSNLVGINVRTIQHFWNVVKYCLTIPESQQAIHLLPIWEPGVADSLYGKASWNINSAFFSAELAEVQKQLDTVEKQLKVVVNLLHALGKTVGFDAIPHTDRYAEIVLANPHFFEWLQREDLKINDHSEHLHKKVQTCIWAWLKLNGSADPSQELPANVTPFFEGSYSEKQRIAILFGKKEDQYARNIRRGSLVDFLFQRGYEPVPATMAPPYRGLEVEVDQDAQTQDTEGRVWRDYRISKPESMSRVFGPLTRYKLYGRLNDNKDWEIDFNKPRIEVWTYVCQQFEALTEYYNFDFMRGDMSHVQMRPDGVPHQEDPYYDFHKAIKAHLAKSRPYFAYFAETFMAPAGYMAYGDEVDHLEQSDADATLGDLQSMVVGSPEFLQNFRLYLDVLYTRSVAPSFTLMTGDKDDPRFDKFYLKGNEARLFIGLFLGDMPSYMGLGFEVRDPHPEPVANEYYSKLFVFHLKDGPKATSGPYLWGKNVVLFKRLTRIRLLAESLLPQTRNADAQWLLYPDPTGHKKLIAWTQKQDPKFVFVVNLDTEKAVVNQKLPAISGSTKQALWHYFSSLKQVEPQQQLPWNDTNYQIDHLQAGECCVFTFLPSPFPSFSDEIFPDT